MMHNFPAEKFQAIETPFYFYNMELLEATLNKVHDLAKLYNFTIHYAVKANANDRLLQFIRGFGFGADCVSGNEIVKAVETGFDPKGIVFAGVGKSDREIEVALDYDIACFNVESIPELEVINQIAALKGKTAKVAIRVNPNVNAHTHKYITTGLDENKFGINQLDLDKVADLIPSLRNIRFEGLHFHIGSQVTDLGIFRELCSRVNEVQEWFIARNLYPRMINVGGGLGIDYIDPDNNLIPDFGNYFKIFNDFLAIKPDQRVHFELGRAMIAQSGNLITRVLYVKEGLKTNFVIVDAGMTELIRPALYQAYHKIENLSSIAPEEKYDVVGPICESSDCFGKALSLPKTSRGDLLVIRSAGAYGEVMASRYNLREWPRSIFSDSI